MGRRAKGTGSVFKYKEFYAGKYNDKWVYGATKLEATDKLNALIAEEKEGGAVNKTITIETAMRKWLQYKASVLQILHSSSYRIETVFHALTTVEHVLHGIFAAPNAEQSGDSPQTSCPWQLSHVDMVNKRFEQSAQTGRLPENDNLDDTP